MLDKSKEKPCILRICRIEDVVSQASYYSPSFLAKETREPFIKCLGHRLNKNNYIAINPKNKSPKAVYSFTQAEYNYENPSNGPYDFESRQNIERYCKDVFFGGLTKQVFFKELKKRLGEPSPTYSHKILLYDVSIKKDNPRKKIPKIIEISCKIIPNLRNIVVKNTKNNFLVNLITDSEYIDFDQSKLYAKFTQNKFAIL